MTEPETRETRAVPERAERPWMPVLAVVVVSTAFAVGWRCGRGWGRMTGW